MNWLNDAIFYQIYPQTFYDTNGDGIGDIEGIIKKLDYIKTLGCNAIWINPCYESPFFDAGYDISDYYTIAERYGTNSDMKCLFEKAHEQGIKVLLDLVVGHTSHRHNWFLESKSQFENDCSDRYIWTDSVWITPEGCDSIRGISDRNGSVAVNYYSIQPSLNYGYANPDPTKPYQESQDDSGPTKNINSVMDIMRFWLNMGADGFRVDMANNMIKCDEDQSENIRFWKKFRAFLDKEYPNAVLVSEWGDPIKALAGGFHMDFVLQHGDMYYNDLFRCEDSFFVGSGDCKKFVDKYIEHYNKVKQDGGFISLPTGNHDSLRYRDKLSMNEGKLLFAFVLTMPGVPFIYYGDEIGMNFLRDIPSVEGGYERTGTRSPMQWNEGKNCGFSSADEDMIYIGVDSAEDRPSVELQENDPDSILLVVKKLCEIRRDNEALKASGDVKFLFCKSNAYPLIYERKNHSDRFIVIINPSEKPEKVSLSEFIDKDVETVYHIGRVAEFEEGNICAPEKSATILKVR